MLRKFFTFLSTAKSCASMGISFFDYAELLIRPWSNEELILVIAVAALIPVLKLSVFLYNTFGIRIPFGIPQHHSKFLLRSFYWVTVAASVFNFLCKCVHGANAETMFILGIVYIIALILDYVEVEETIHKIEEQDKNK